MSIRPAKARAPWVGDSSSFNQDQGIILENDNLSLSVIPFWDTFDSEKPFWNDTPVIDSGEWSIDTVNGTLDGDAGNTYQIFRYNIEGDYDYALKVKIPNSISAGIRMYNSAETTVQRLIIFESGGNYRIEAEATGKTTVTVSDIGTDTAWLRVTRRKNVISYYYKLTDNAAWTLITSHSNVDLGHGVLACLDSAVGAEIYEVLFFDNSMPNRIIADSPKSVDLGNITGNVDIDARRGNVFYGVLTGNITLQNPTYPAPWQKIIFCLQQDGTGSRTISFGADYNFSSDLASPTLTTSASAWDYLGFVYNPKNDSWDYIAEVKDFS